MLAPLYTLSTYLHNLNPIVFELGPIKPRWYGLSYLMGFICGYILVRKLARDGMLRLPVEKVADLALAVCIWGVLVGGRLGYCLFYDLPNSLKEGVTPLLWRFSDAFPYWGLLRVNEGGMAAHGGVLFTILVLIIFAKRNKVSVVNLGDAACMVVPIGLFFGRIANFINGELYGHATSVSWGVKFPSEIYAPTNGKLDETVQRELPNVFQKLYGNSPVWFTPEGFDEGLRMLSIELHRRSADALAAVSEILPARHPSQLYEALFEGLLLFVVVWTIGRLWKKDGMASGAFLVFYPLMRILGEQFRVGDTPVHFLGIDISKGVLYSLIMLIPALVYWGYWIHKDRRFPWVRQPAKPKTPAEPAAS